MQTNTPNTKSKISINNNNSFCNCDCRLGVYSRFLGPTFDQIILNSIEVFLKLFDIFRCKPDRLTKATQTEEPKIQVTDVAVCCSCPSEIQTNCDCPPSDCSLICENAVRLPDCRIIGDFQNECQCPFDVLYAITRITKYHNFATYEIMKPTRNQPKRLPKLIDGVFVLRKNL